MHRSQNADNLPPKPARQAIKRDHRQQLSSPVSAKVSPQTKKPCFNIPTDGVVPAGNKAGPPTVLTIVQVPGKNSLQPLPSASAVAQIPDTQTVDVTMSSSLNRRSDPPSSGRRTSATPKSILLPSSTNPPTTTTTAPKSTPTPKPPNTIQDYLEDFKKKMDEGLDFLKRKITDPDTGLETKVTDLEKAIWETDDGLNDKVDDLITVVKDPATGLVSKVNQLLENAPTVSDSANPSGGQSAQLNTQQYDQLNRRIVDLENKVAYGEFQSQVVLSWADNMYKDHKSLKKQVSFHAAKHHANELIVGGIQEDDSSNLKKSAIQFLEDKLNVKIAQGELYHARRVGKQGKIIQVEEEDDQGALQVRKIQCPHHMVVKCSPPLKSRLLAKKKLLSGLVDPEGYKYFVAQYLPDSFKAAQNKHREEVTRIMTQNSKKQPKDKIPVRVTGTDLYVNNKVKLGFIQPPSPGDVCQHKLHFNRELDSFELIRTRPITKEGNTFQGFTVRVSKLLGVSIAYSKVRIAAPKARHLMCAYNVSGMKDSCDDGEDHAGLLIAKMIKTANLTNVAIFMARETGPDQLGARRFDIIRDVVKELFQLLDFSTNKRAIDDRWIPKTLHPTSVDVPSLGDQLQRTGLDDWADQGDDWDTQPERQETPADDWSISDQTETKMTF